MPKLLLLPILLLSFSVVSQTKITVMDGFMEDQPMKDVVVLSEGNVKLGTTNEKGVFFVPASETRITLYFEGYEQKKLYLYGKPLVVQLQPQTVFLSSSVISNSDSEARAIIKQAIQNKKTNSIENLKTYEYKSYSKFLVTASTDSMPYILMPKNEKDSSYNDIRRLLDKSHLMLGERAMDHKFSDKYGTKNIVKATRISGTKLPMYEFVAMQPISNNFDQEKISFFFREFVNPVSNSGLREYRYRISDEDEIEGEAMFVIAFFPSNRNSSKQKIKGYLWIDKKTKALARFYAENLSDSNVAELEMDWTNYKNYWFPKQQRFRMDGGEISYPSVKDSITSEGQIVLDTIDKKEKVWLHLSTSFKDIISPKDFESKEFKGYTNEIDLRTMEDSENTLTEYRDSILTETEQNTYVKIDSIGQKYNMDRNIRLLRILSSGGKYTVGNFDLDLTKIINYNDYEGFRLGFGGETNYKFNDTFSVNAYGAYGFKDEKVKFGGGINWLVNKPFSGRLFANYSQDVAPAGREKNELQNNYLQYLNKNLSNIYNDHFFSFRKVNLGYQQDFLQNVTVNIAGIYREQTAEFNYQYKNNRPDEKFLSFDTQLGIRWAPRDKNVRTPYGKVTINSGLPVFYLNFTQGWNVFNADYTPTRLDFSYIDQYQTFLGRTNFQLNTGAVFGNSPLLNLYEGMGNARSGKQIFKHFGLSGLNTFETMRPGEFYSDKYFSFQLSQMVAGFKFFKQEIYPEFIYRGLIGDMKNQTDHKFVNFKTAKHYFQEAGLEFNQLLFGIFGVGAYYRFGAYRYDTFDENFFFKVTMKFRFF